MIFFCLFSCSVMLTSFNLLCFLFTSVDGSYCRSVSSFSFLLTSNCPTCRLSTCRVLTLALFFHLCLSSWPHSGPLLQPFNISHHLPIVAPHMKPLFFSFCISFAPIFVFIKHLCLLVCLILFCILVLWDVWHHCNQRQYAVSIWVPHSTNLE